MLKLQFVDNRQGSFWIVDENFGIGSEIKNQMVIKDDQVRPFHATINQRTGRLFITPKDEAGQTFVNGHQINDATEILIGDVIGIGNIELKLIDPARHVPRTPTPNSPNSKVKPADMGWQIKAMTGPLSGKTIPVDSSKIVGRDSAADIVIAGGHISRRHAEFLLRDSQLWVRDLGSSNGTYVNNKKLDETALYLGDEIKFDAVIFRVVVGRAAPKDKAAAEEANMEKTQFRPALNIPPAARSAEPRPVAAPSISPIPAPMPAQMASAPVVNQAPALESAQIPTKTTSGIQMSPMILLVMVVVLAILAGLVFMNM
jgi:pSer/pThr/pTyr-binding forkhead associated (FHA) protein